MEEKAGRKVLYRDTGTLQTNPQEFLHVIVKVNYPDAMETGFQLDHLLYTSATIPVYIKKPYIVQVKHSPVVRCQRKLVKALVMDLEKALERICY